MQKQLETVYLVKDVNLSELARWFNAYYGVKKTGEEFSISDIQGYTRRGYVPKYLGGHQIESDTNKVIGTTSYSVIDRIEFIEKKGNYISSIR